jgi:hypothetical protein
LIFCLLSDIRIAIMMQIRLRETFLKYIVPMLGMLMLPKTICYILMLCAFLKAVSKTSD